MEFDIKITANDLFRYNMRQSYTTMQGPVSIVIAILFLVNGVVTAQNARYDYMVLYFAVALLFLLYIPVTLKLRSKKSLEKNEVLSKSLHYSFTDSAIVVTQGDQEGELPWDQIYKMISNKNYIYIYSNRINAYIIPRAQMEESYAGLKELAESRLPKYRVKMKKA